MGRGKELLLLDANVTSSKDQVFCIFFSTTMLLPNPNKKLIGPHADSSLDFNQTHITVNTT